MRNGQRTTFLNKRFNAIYSLWIENHRVVPVKIKFAPLLQGGGPMQAYQIDRGSEMTAKVVEVAYDNRNQFDPHLRHHNPLPHKSG